MTRSIRSTRIYGHAQSSGVLCEPHAAQRCEYGRSTGADEGVVPIVANSLQRSEFEQLAQRCRNRETDTGVYSSRDVTELNAPLASDTFRLIYAAELPLTRLGSAPTRIPLETVPRGRDYVHDNAAIDRPRSLIKLYLRPPASL